MAVCRQQRETGLFVQCGQKKKTKGRGNVVAKVRTNRLVLVADDAIAPKAPEAKQSRKVKRKKDTMIRRDAAQRFRLVEPCRCFF